MKIQSFEYTGEGMRRVYENGQWTVGIKNYKPANDKSLFNELGRVGKRRLTTFLWQVCAAPSQNRACTSQCTRLAIFAPLQK
uniref:hypothetical protein n=1 Tax=Enterocloster clostridioformis TaxID=1531 RepID=UPI003A8F19E2